MSSANPHTAKNIFSDTKRRLSERVSMNIHNTASVAREIIRGKNMNIYRLVQNLEMSTFFCFYSKVRSRMTLSSHRQKDLHQVKQAMRTV